MAVPPKSQKIGNYECMRIQLTTECTELHRILKPHKTQKPRKNRGFAWNKAVWMLDLDSHVRIRGVFMERLVQRLWALSDWLRESHGAQHSKFPNFRSKGCVPANLLPLR